MVERWILKLIIVGIWIEKRVIRRILRRIIVGIWIRKRKISRILHRIIIRIHFKKKLRIQPRVYGRRIRKLW